MLIQFKYTCMYSIEYVFFRCCVDVRTSFALRVAASCGYVVRVARRECAVTCSPRRTYVVSLLMRLVEDVSIQCVTSPDAALVRTKLVSESVFSSFFNTLKGASYDVRSTNNRTCA